MYSDAKSQYDSCDCNMTLSFLTTDATVHCIWLFNKRKSFAHTYNLPFSSELLVRCLFCLNEPPNRHVNDSLYVR